MKQYTYNYHPGLIVAKNRRITMLTYDDTYSYYFNPNNHYFDPICLNESTLLAYSFKKSYGEHRCNHFFTRNNIVLTRRVGTSKFYCHNSMVSPDFEFLHELQDFFILFNQKYHYYEIELDNFIRKYGSRKINDFDI